MRVVGFSFIRNAEKFGYPIGEALRSIMPLCDEVVVAVGNSEDATRELVASLDPRIRIIDTVWDNSLQAGGAVLANETNKAFRAVDDSADWCVYIQGDEVLHEDGYDALRKGMHRWKDDSKVDGLLLKYRHFYGSFDYIGTSSKWYRHEIRVIKNNKNIFSYRDAQGFRKGENEKLRVKAVDAWVHHYGWVRPPETMQAKQFNFSRFYNGEDWYAQNQEVYTGAFDYSQIDTLEKFSGTHPRVMQDRISRMNWKFEYDLSYNHIKPKDRFKNLIEKLTGKRPFDYKNYKLM